MEYTYTSNDPDWERELEESYRLKEEEKRIKEAKALLNRLGMKITPDSQKEHDSNNLANLSEVTRSFNEYDLAISFAGEDRVIAEEIADRLKELGFCIFYDKYEQADMWGKNLFEHLSDVYGKRAKFCLIIISKNYANKHWTNHERKAAQDKAFSQNKEYILPLRLDNTEIPGINKTTGYIDYNETGLDGTIILLRQKIGK